MRKDKGLNGDLDRLPMLTWIMFLKFLDDMEQIAEQEARMAGKRFRPALESPYRWRDWAAKQDGITGDELISFVNNEEAVRPDGKKGAGLFAYLRGLQGANGGDRRDVIATVFKGTINRMINGYLLRDVINKVSDVHFTSSDEIHTLGHLYESMFKEMRDAAGDSGEFYTPRAVVRFIVEIMNPRLGEVILDPACGTGGFLVESFKHLEKQCKTVEDRQVLQNQSIFWWRGQVAALSLDGARQIIADFLNSEPGTPPKYGSSVYWLLHQTTSLEEIQILHRALRSALEPIIAPKAIHDPRASLYVRSIIPTQIFSRSPKGDLGLNLGKILQRSLIDGKLQRLRVCESCKILFVAKHARSRVCSKPCKTSRDKQQQKIRQCRYLDKKRSLEKASDRRT